MKYINVIKVVVEFFYGKTVRVTLLFLSLIIVILKVFFFFLFLFNCFLFIIIFYNYLLTLLINNILGNIGSTNATDIGLFGNDNYYFSDSDINSRTFNDCLSRTERTNDSDPKLLIRKSSTTGYNNFIPYSHKDKIIVDSGNDGKNADILYCGCEHYPCKTITYSLTRTDFVFHIFLFIYKYFDYFSYFSYYFFFLLFYFFFF